MSKNEDPRRYLSEILQPLDFQTSFERRQQHIRRLLARYLNLKSVVALIGAGASRPLGYPVWNRFAKDTLIEADKTVREEFATDPQSKEGKKALQLCSKFRRDTRYIGKPGKEYSSQVILGKCEENLASVFPESPAEKDDKKHCKKFRDIVKKQFEKSHDKFGLIPKTDILYKDAEKNPYFTVDGNPYLALLQLPIMRFITTNYDFEIERALLYTKKIPNDLTDKQIAGLTIGKEEDKNSILRWIKGKSFSQVDANHKQLAKFPVSRFEGSKHTVFHCHGRIDDQESCIVTEEDFQRWYLKEEYESKPFRQTLELTLSSNPILIMGYGLGDLDLTRWLRIITANRPRDKVRNPLFCINFIPKTDFKGPNRRYGNKREVEDECDALYLRYGLHVIPVYEKDPDNPKSKIKTLSGELIEIEQAWREWYDGILMKPMFRKTPKHNFKLPPEQDPGSYYHYEIKIPKSVSVSPKIYSDLKTSLDKVMDLKDKDRLTDYPKLAVILGDGGTGKSWITQQYLQKLEKKKNKNGKNVNTGWTFVFWNSYYANDVLTGIDRLIEFIDEHQNNGDGEEAAKASKSEDRFEKLSQILRDKKRDKMIIVFDGIEKLLNPTEENMDGKAISPEVKRFFHLISDQEVACRIILTTRLFPLDILPRGKKNEGDKGTKLSRIKERREKITVAAPRYWLQYLLEDKDEFSDIGSDDQEIERKLSALCSLVEGHMFCIILIRGMFKYFTDPKDKKRAAKVQEKFDNLMRDIANTPVDRRTSRVIREAIACQERTADIHLKRSYGKHENIVEKFIERISLFMHPIRREVADVCFIDATGKELKTEKEKAEVKKLLDDLVKRSLVQMVYLERETENQSAVFGYVVHPLIKSYVHQTLHKSNFNSSPSIQLPGFTSAMENVDPGSTAAVKTTRGLFTRLLETAEKRYEDEVRKKVARFAKEKEPYLGEKICFELCRGAFSILRSRFCANTVTRWGDYREYLQMVLKIYDTAREVSRKTWKHNEPTPEGIGLSESPSAPLYSDEIAWVYNEIGLASISMGNLLNATALWDQGLEISKLIDKGTNGRYVFQSEFNLGTTFIHLGKLNIAMSYLDRAFEIANRLKDPNLISRVKASIALVKYLQGNLEESHEDYEKAYEGMENNPRARGVFYCYHGELLIKLGRFDQAKLKIDQSRHIGEASHYPDLRAYAGLAYGNYLKSQRKYDEAQNEYSSALKIARKGKIRRVEAGALSAMSRLAHALNDTDSAKRRAIESIKISNEYSLCLHQTVGLLALGNALVKEGELRDLGMSYLETAKDLAKNQGYFLRMHEAENELQKLKST